MRKMTFFPKLAFSNLYRNRATYFPYLLACMVSIITFYCLLAINFNDSIMQMRGDVIIQQFTAIGTVILAVFCTVLLFYTNSFLIKRRKKEIGLYSILGMEKKNIAVLLLFETLFIAGIALVFGLLAGILLARLLYLLLLRIVQFPVVIDLPIYWQAIAITVVFFALVFLLTLLTNLRQVHIANPVEMMAGAKHGEKEPKASWLLTIIGVLTMAAGYVIALRVQSPIEAILLFLLAAFLVIIGTFCLFTSGSIAFLKGLRRKKSYYYTPKHFIPISGMIYRMKQNAAGLASICILSCMVLVTVSSTVCLYLGAEDALHNRYPHEFSLSLNNAEDRHTAIAGGEAIAEQHNLTILNERDYRSISLPFAQAGEELKLIPLEDYNRAENKSETLNPGEALLFCSGGTYDENSLTLNGVQYTLRPIEFFDGFENGAEDVSTTYTLVLPTLEEVQAAAPEGEAWMAGTITFETEGAEADKQNFYTDYRTYLQEVPKAGTIYLNYREEVRSSWYMTHGGFLFLGIYFGILFMLAAAMIIYYKQLSEGSDDAERFEILQKVGMSGDEVKQTIQSQIRTVFFLPLVVAIVHILVAFNPVRRALLLFGLTNTALFVLAMVATILVYAGVYAFVYHRTARAYYKIVRREDLKKPF